MGNLTKEPAVWYNSVLEQVFSGNAKQGTLLLAGGGVNKDSGSPVNMGGQDGI